MCSSSLVLSFTAYSRRPRHNDLVMAVTLLWRVSIGERLEYAAVLVTGDAVASVVPDVFVAVIAFGRGAIGETGKQIGDQ